MTHTATIVVALAAKSAGRPDLIHSPKGSHANNMTSRTLGATWHEQIVGQVISVSLLSAFSLITGRVSSHE